MLKLKIKNSFTSKKTTAYNVVAFYISIRGDLND